MGFLEVAGVQARTFHAAAMKQVPACEYNPFEAVQTNVVGTAHVLDGVPHANHVKARIAEIILQKVALHGRQA